jgi:hypothetical protein
VSRASLYYRLDGHAVHPSETFPGRSRRGDWRVAETVIGVPGATASARVSTVFLGLNHADSLDAPPAIFETMVFWHQHDLDEACERYATWDDATAGHLRWTEIVREAYDLWLNDGARYPSR